MTDITIKSGDVDNYADLRKSFNYDKHKATRLAQAMNEGVRLQKRLKQLNKIKDDNTDLVPFLWMTADGQVIALHDIEDSHLKNIIGHVTRQGRTLSEQLIAEAESRGIDVEAESLPPTQAITARSSVYDDYDEANEEWMWEQ